MKICIIGAGAAGIITASCLISCSREQQKEEGALQITILESSSESYGIGGIFNPARINDGASPVYPFLRSNLPRILMQNPLLEWPTTAGSEATASDFPSHTEMSRYLQLLAEKLNLRKFIRFNCKVTEILTVTGGRATMRVTSVTTTTHASDNNDGVVRSQQEAEEECDFVFACTGRFTKPHIPPYFLALQQQQQSEQPTQQQQLRIVHSTQINWTNATWLKDLIGGGQKDIALVGAGSSARDILLKLLQTDDELSPRSVTWINGKLRSRFACPETEQILLSNKAAEKVRLNFVVADVPSLEALSALEKCRVVILATGFEPNANDIKKQGGNLAEHSCFPRFVSIGQHGTVAPMAMLYWEVQAAMRENRVLREFFFGSTSFEVPSPVRFAKRHPNDVPGELPFTAYCGRVGSDSNDDALLHFLQHLFVAAESRLRAFGKRCLENSLATI